MKKACLAIIVSLFFGTLTMPVKAVNDPVQRWVVIIGYEDPKWNNKYDTYYCYHVMRYRFDIADDNIMYLFWSPSAAFDPSVVDNSSDKQTVRWTITSWLASRAHDNDLVFIYFSGGHGGGFNGISFNETGAPLLEGGRIDSDEDEGNEHQYPNGTWFGVDECLLLKWMDIYVPPECYWDDEIRTDLSSLHYGTLMVMLSACLSLEGSCFSGGFIDDLSYQNRIILTSTNETSHSYGDLNGDMFSEFDGPFFDALYGWHCDASSGSLVPQYEVNADADGNGNVSILEAFEYAYQNDYARWAVRTQNGTIPDPWPGYDESPWFDDDGDRLPTYRDGIDHLDADQGLLASQTYLQSGLQPGQPVDLSVVSIVPTTPHYPIVQVYHGDMRWNGTHVSMSYNVTVSRVDGHLQVAIVWANVGLKRTNANNLSECRVVSANITALGPGGSSWVELIWNETETMKPGNWTISAFINVVSWSCFDENLANNIKDYGKVNAKELVGDINGDGLVDILDAIKLSKAYGKREGDPKYNPDADLNKDKTVDIYDAIMLSSHFGEYIGPGLGSASGTSTNTQTATAASGTAVSVDPAQLTVFKGETFTVNVKVTDVTDLYGWEFKLYWNSTVLNCTNVQIQTPDVWVNNTLEFAPGLEPSYNATHARFWKAQAATDPAPSFNGSMTIVTLTFQATQTGTTPLQLQDTKLGNSTAQLIPHSVSSGSVSVYYGRYMRSDTWTVNGLNAYVLNATQSAASASYTQSADGYYTVYWGIRAWVRHSNGVEAEISLDGQTGTPKAIVSRGSGYGIQSNTVAVAETPLQPTDALVIRVYMKIGAGEWTQCASFTTEQLQSTRLQATTWTVYYYTYVYKPIRYERTSGTLYWGTATYNTRIQNIQHN